MMIFTKMSFLYPFPRRPRAGAGGVAMPVSLSQIRSVFHAESGQGAAPEKTGLSPSKNYSEKSSDVIEQAHRNGGILIIP